MTGLATALAGKVSSVNGLTPDDSGALVLPQATSGAAGLMAAADKLKLDTFTNYTEKSGTEVMCTGIHAVSAEAVGVCGEF